MSAAAASRWLCAVALAAGLGWPGAVAGRSVLEDRQQRAALVWQALAVEHPVEIGADGWPAAGGAVVAEPVEVSGRAAARVHLASLAVARVRVLGRGRPVFHRLTGAARVAEAPAELAAGTWLLEQPPGEASDWLVTAEAPTTVVIEGVRPRTGDLIWEHAIGAVLAWIDAGGPLPALPEVPEVEVTAQALLADEEIAAAIDNEGDTDDALRAAVRGWRRAAAIQRLTALRTPIRAAFGLELRPRQLVDGAPLGVGGWQRVRGATSELLALRGPGVLWIEGRAIGAGGEIRVASEGRALAAVKLRAPARLAEGTGRGGAAGGAVGRLVGLAGGTGAAGLAGGTGSAGLAGGTGGGAGGAGGEGGRGLAGGTGSAGLAGGTGSAGTGETTGDEGLADRRGDGGRPREDVDLGAESAAAGRGDLGVAQRLAAEVGAPVGAPGVVRVALAPGLHEVRVEVRGADTAVLLRSGRTNPRLLAALRGEGVGTQLRRARRALRRSESSRVPVVAALLASVAGERVTKVGRADSSPTLALAQAELLAQADGLTEAQRVDAARTLVNRAGRASPGPLVWRARQRGLELAGDDEVLVRALVGSRPAEAPTAMLARLAEAIEGPALALRSPAVALLELARRRVPLDAGLRAVYRERWRTGTRWAALRADEAAGAGWTWIEPRPAVDERIAGARALWRWPVGKPQVLRVAPGPAGRTALLRMYAEVPARGGAIGLHIGEQRWLTPVLARVEPWQVALPPGKHPVTMTAPVGATVWSSRAPAERPPDGHLLRMWPAGPGEAVRFVLPAGEAPAFVRVEVRGLGEIAADAVVRVWISRDDGPTQAVDVRLPAGDPAVVPVQAADALGGRAVVVVRVEAGVRALSVRVADDGRRVAVAAAIRATRAQVEEADARGVIAEGGAGGELVAGTGGAELAGEELAAGTGGAGDGAGGELAAGTGGAGGELARGTGGAGGTRGAGGELAAGTGGSEPVGGAGGELAAGTGGAGGAGREPAGEVAHGTGGVVVQEDGPGLARLAELSRALQADPDDKALRLQRAELLLDLDQPGYAYVDWQAVTAGGLSRDLAKPAMALADRLDALDAPDTIDLTTGEPVVVAPALAAAIGPEVARLNAIEPAVAAVRADGPAEGLAVLDRLGLDTRAERTSFADPAAESEGGAGAKDRSGAAGADRRAGARDSAAAAAVLRAGLLDQQGEADAAARVWAGVEARHGLWQAGLMGVYSFLAALDGATARPGSLQRPGPGEPRAEGAALAYGLALSVRRTVRTPAVQRLVTVAATRSKWSRVASSERDAGIESLTVPRAPALPSPNAAVRQALVVPPWSHAEATLLRPGFATVLALRREASALAVELWCEEVRPGAGAAEAAVRVTLDGVDLQNGPVPVRTVAGPSVDGLPAGRHRVEVELDAASRGHLCSVRLRDGAGTVGSVRPTTWRVARPGQPVEVVVLGPTTLAIEARALISEGAARGGRAGARGGARARGGGGGRGDAGVRGDGGGSGDARGGGAGDARGGGAGDARGGVAGDARGGGAGDARGVGRGEAGGGGGAGPAGRGAEGAREASGGRVLQVAAARGRGALAVRATLVLPEEVDPLAVPEAERTIHPALAATRVIALPDPGAHRVVLSTTRGAALVRLQQRLDGEPIAVPRPPVRSLDLGAVVDEIGPIALPAAALPAVAMHPRAAQRFGTTFAELHIGSDDLDGADDLQPRLTASVRLGWARELLARRVWLQAAPELRPRQDTAITGGGALALQVLFPRAGLRARATGEVLAGRALGESAWALRAGLRVDRPTWVGRRLQLLPSAELALRGQSLGPAALAADEPIHPRIYTKYGATHPVALRPGVELRWQRWQDARVYGASDVVVNSDFKGLDQWNLRGGMVGVLAVLRRVVPEFAAEYEASIRLADRFRGATYVQHRVRVGLGAGVWAGRSARVVFGVSDSLIGSAPFGLRNVLDVWLRIDLVLGRGLRDYGPLDMAFRPVREPRLWLGGEGAP